MERSKTSEAVEGRLMGGYLALGRFEIVRYKAIVEEIFQAWIPKIRISTTTGAAALHEVARKHVLCIAESNTPDCVELHGMRVDEAILRALGNSPRIL